MAVMAAREHRAEAASLHALLHPRSVAVIGASATEGTIGEALAGEPARGRVHRRRLPRATRGAEAVAGLAGAPGRHRDRRSPSTSPWSRCRPTPCRTWSASAPRPACAASSWSPAGSPRAGEEGARLQRELVRTRRAQGMRVVGPNSFGMLNTDPAVRLNASLSPDAARRRAARACSASPARSASRCSRPPPRRGLGAVELRLGRQPRRRVGQRPAAVLGGRPAHRRRSACTWRASATPASSPASPAGCRGVKPVVVVKSGTSGFGVPAGHVVRASRAPREAFDAMLRQAGVIRTENIHQLFDVAQLLVHQPLPAGQPGRRGRQLRRARRAGRRRRQQLGPRAGRRPGHRATAGRRRRLRSRAAQRVLDDPRRRRRRRQLHPADRGRRRRAWSSGRRGLGRVGQDGARLLRRAARGHPRGHARHRDGARVPDAGGRRPRARGGDAVRAVAPARPRARRSTRPGATGWRRAHLVDGGARRSADVGADGHPRPDPGRGPRSASCWPATASSVWPAAARRGRRRGASPPPSGWAGRSR